MTCRKAPWLADLPVPHWSRYWIVPYASNSQSPVETESRIPGSPYPRRAPSASGAMFRDHHLSLRLEIISSDSLRDEFSAQYNRGNARRRPERGSEPQAKAPWLGLDLARRRNLGSPRRYRLQRSVTSWMAFCALVLGRGRRPPARDGM